MNKKISSNWNLAATYYLTVAFATNILSVIVGGVLVALSLTGTAVTSVVSIMVMFATTIVATWLGVLVSAKWVNKKYVVHDKNKLINLAIVYSIALFVLYSFVLLPFGENIIVKLIRIFSLATITTFQGTGLLVQIVRSVLVVALFGIFSRKYLQNS